MQLSQHILTKQIYKSKITEQTESLQKIRVGVLMGGKSVENEVSFNSGRTVCDHLDSQLYTVIPLYQTRSGILYILPWHFLHRGKTTDFEHRLASEAQVIAWDDLKSLIDFMYIATHGQYAEDGTLQGFLELLQIPYLGAGVYASALRMNKIMHKKILALNGIAVPKYIGIYVHELHELSTQTTNAALEYLQQRMLAENIQLPCVVKPASEGSSLGVRVVTNFQDLIPAVEHAATISGSLKEVIIEEKIDGMEFSCITLVDYTTGNYLPLPPTEIVPEPGTLFFDYEQKYMPGRSIKHTPARCAPHIITAIQHTCMRVMNILEFPTISRIDGFVTADERIVIFDPNSLSGMGPTSFFFLQAAQIGMSHTKLINHLIETELWNYRMEHSITQYRQEQQNSTHKKRVAVLMGGASHERETSLNSGRNVFYKLLPEKYIGLPIFMTQSHELYHINAQLLVHNSTQEIEELLTADMKISWQDLSTIADFVFIALHGGAGENGCVQGALEMLGLPYNGSGVFASALCMNKFKTNQLLRSYQIPVPEHILLSVDEWSANNDAACKTIEQQLPFPLIIKPHDDGCSVMVQKARTREELSGALTAIFANDKKYALIEECIQGMELTVGVLGNQNPRALPPSYCVTTGGILSIEEKFLPGAGENQTPAPLAAHTIEFIQQQIVQTYTIAQCKGYARIDCFYQTAAQSKSGSEQVVIIEINTLPGMTPATCIFHQAAEIGMRPMEFIDTIITLGFELHQSYTKTTTPVTLSISN